MITPIYPDVQQGLTFPSYEVQEEPILPSSSPPPSQLNSNFLYNLSLLKDKLHQIESLASIAFVSFDHHPHRRMDHPPEPSISTLIQEIIVTASSMMFSCQQISFESPTPNNNPSAGVFFSNHQETIDQDHDHNHWYGYNNFNSINNYNNNEVVNTITTDENHTKTTLRPKRELSPQNYDIVELNAADLLAKYTHHCHVCGKGFKRDANLRMHMRAHGEQYKSIAALISPSKVNTEGGDQRSKYSCPQVGCRWNKGHVKFQPLKSMICAKNHYRRSHCPKMYVCNRCGGKHFSVLSDLRTHEKHCGDLKWQCSCGTTFSRKDKLMGHLAVFIGHTSAVRKREDDLTRMQ